MGTMVKICKKCMNNIVIVVATAVSDFFVKVGAICVACSVGIDTLMAMDNDLKVVRRQRQGLLDRFFGGLLDAVMDVSNVLAHVVFYIVSKNIILCGGMLVEGNW